MRRIKSQSGQAVTEYMLVLSVLAVAVIFFTNTLMIGDGTRQNPKGVIPQKTEALTENLATGLTDAPAK